MMRWPWGSPAVRSWSSSTRSSGPLSSIAPGASGTGTRRGARGLRHRPTRDHVILRGVGAADGFDVAVVGASLGGCTAARFYGLRGARVALIEQRPDPGAWKVVCTHAIQSSAAPTIERLGL